MTSILVEIFAVVAGILVPIVIDLLFGATPVRLSVKSIRRAIENARLRSRQDRETSKEISAPPEAPLRLSPFLDPVDVVVANNRVVSCGSHHLLSLFALESAERAQKIERRANVFIISGIFIAIGGLIAFYILYKSTPPATDIWDHIFSILPNFGILFFIEFVALFCLRQYRPTIDEFRYFEALARSREDALIASKVLYERGDSSSGSETIAASKIFSAAGRLNKDETTEIVETRKFHRDELLVVEKALDIIGVASKRNDKQEKN